MILACVLSMTCVCCVLACSFDSVSEAFGKENTLTDDYRGSNNYGINRQNSLESSLIYDQSSWQKQE